MVKISVILTSFNHAKYIREAIGSALNQTFTDFEVIILDDCSSDNSKDLINQYSDSRIKTFYNEVNKGPVEGVNKAISEVALGEYIAIHRSDDIWEPDKLKKQVAFLDTHLDIGAVFTNAIAISEDSSPLSDENHFYYNIFDQPNRTRYEWLRYFFSHGNALCHPSVLIRKKCYDECGLYRNDMAQFPDFDMWIRLCLKYEIHVLPEKLVRFRVRDNEANASGIRPDIRIRTQYEFYKLLQNYRKLTRFEDLTKVFPSAAKYNRNEETDISFVLGMVVLDQMSFPFTRLFGLDLLLEVISDPERAANIKRLYYFDYKSFIALTGQHDVFSIEELTKKNKIYTSYSWRLIRTLRILMRVIRKPKLLFARLQKQPPPLTDDYSVAVPFGYPVEEWESTPSLAVVCHMFYVDMIGEIARYLWNIPFPFDLYITTDTHEKQVKIERFFYQWRQGKVEVRIAPNRGRDIAPTLITCHDVYDNYEYILHIHTKKSPYHERLSNWRFYLLETLIGSTDVVKSVFEAFRASPNLGMIAPQHFKAVRNSVRWGCNFKSAQTITRRMGVQISQKDPIDFPSGSMFWARSAAIKPLLDCNLSFDEFPDEAGQIDGTLAHAIERLFFFTCERAGFTWVKINNLNLSSRSEKERFLSKHDDLINFINQYRYKLIKKNTAQNKLIH